MRSLTCCHNIVLFAVLLSLFSCHKKPALYKKEFTAEEHKKLAISLIDGIGQYYQGSPPEQFLLQEALKHNPNNANIWRELGVPYLKRGLASTAMSVYYPKAVELDPVGWQGWRGYLYLYFYRDYQNALADFNATDTLTPNFVDYPQSLSVDYMRGICYLQMNQFQNAIDLFDKHIEYETKTVGFEYIDSKTFLYKGIAQLKSDQKDQAKTTFETGLTVDPTNADLMYWLAKWHLQAGEKEKANEWAEKSKVQFLKGNHNHRPYVEEFYQTYLADINKILSITQ